MYTTICTPLNTYAQLCTPMSTNVHHIHLCTPLYTSYTSVHLIKHLHLLSHYFLAPNMRPFSPVGYSPPSLSWNPSKLYISKKCNQYLHCMWGGGEYLITTLTLLYNPHPSLSSNLISCSCSTFPMEEEFYEDRVCTNPVWFSEVDAFLRLLRLFPLTSSSIGWLFLFDRRTPESKLCHFFLSLLNPPSWCLQQCFFVGSRFAR